jgi:thiol-disulfide isomerase/thioredoxin
VISSPKLAGSKLAGIVRSRWAREIGTWTLYAAVGLGAYWFFGRRTSGPKVGSRAAAFVLPRVGEPGEVRFDPASKQATLVEVFASWCGACRRATPRVTSAWEKQSGERVNFVAVSVDDSMDAARAAQRTWGLRGPVGLDVDGAFSAAYHVELLPTFVLIDRDGVIRRVEAGVPSESDAVAWFEELD